MACFMLAHQLARPSQLPFEEQVSQHSGPCKEALDLMALGPSDTEQILDALTILLDFYKAQPDAPGSDSFLAPLLGITPPSRKHSPFYQPFTPNGTGLSVESGPRENGAIDGRTPHAENDTPHADSQHMP